MLYVLLLTSLLLAATLSVILRAGSGGTSAPELWPDVPRLEIEPGEAGSLPPSVTAVATEAPGTWNVTISLSSDVQGETCALSGEFNHWNAQSHLMERTSDGRWRIDLVLASGVYRYKFCVDETRWLPDPENGEGEDDGFESSNSILRLGALGRPDEIRGVATDGVIATAVLEHDPAKPMYRHRLADGSFQLRYRTLVGDVERVDVALRGSKPISMAPIVSPAPFQFWEAVVADPGRAVEYAFAVVDGATHASDPRTHTLDPAMHTPVRTPAWAREAIWYQIFPERFRNGDSSNDPEPKRRWTSAWNEPAEFEGQDGQTFWEFYVYQRMYGGDLKGIEEKLDHITALGVNALYLNPVFHAAGPHKYNATDFRHIDTGFGAGEDYHESTKSEDLLDPSTWTWTPSDRVFLDFLATCKQRGLRVIIDAVFNHVGVQHPAFRDVQTNGEASRFADWFHVKSWQPFRYAGWAGFGELPAFAKDDDGLVCDAVKEHIFAVTRRWMDPDGDGDPSDGIDGWRLDVPMELPPAFWAEWRKLVKSINPDAYVSGEIWDRADGWLGGEHFDAVMNYRFAEPVVQWVGNKEKKVAVSELDRRLLEVRLAYPEDIGLALMNLVDSHDTDRVASMLLNPDRPYDRSNRIQLNDDYNSGRPHPEHFQRVRLVALFQMTYYGAPMIYYGDEIGMWGADDPTNRQPMIWKDLGPYDNSHENYFDDDLFAFYRRAIELRRRFPALRTGSFETVLTDDHQDLYVFARELDGCRMLVALNAGEHEAAFELPFADHGAWEPVFSDDSPGASPERGTAHVPPIAGRVWRRVS